MSKKVTVFNHNPNNYGLKLNTDGRNRYLVIRAGTRFQLTEDDIFYLSSSTRTFSDGFLRIEDDEVKESIGQVDENPNDLTKEEIEKLLSEHPKTIEKEIKEITAMHVKNKIIEIAKEMDLTSGRLKVLKDAFGVDVFADSTDNEV